MTQIKTKIPAELEPAAVGGMVSDAKYIKDRVKDKTQKDVNAEFEGRVSTLEESVGTGGSVDSRIAQAKSEVIGDAGSDYNTLGKLEDKLHEEVANRASQNYTKSETYNKTELNNMITTPNQEYVTVTATDQTAAATDVLPATGEADTVYRVGNWDGTQYDTTCYTEYAWNGSAYVTLNTKEYGIDDEPTFESDNLVKSGGVRHRELYQGVAKMFNGSLGDTGDARTCHTCVVPTFGAKYAFVNTTRKPHTGYHYVFQADVTDLKSDIGKGEKANTLSGNITTIAASYFPVSSYIDLTSVPNAVGISVRVFEVSDSAISLQTLDRQNISAADFEGEVFQIVCTNAIPQLVDKAIKEDAVNPLRRLISEPLYEDSYIQPVEYELGDISFSSSGMTYGSSMYKVRTTENFILHLYGGDIIGLTDYDGIRFSIGARLLDGTYITNNNMNSNYVVQVEGYYAILVSRLDSANQSSPDTLGSLIKVVRKSKLQTISKNSGLTKIYNGSIGNAGNIDYVHTQVIPTNGAKYAILQLNRKNTTGYTYYVGYALTSSLYDIGASKTGNLWSGLLVNKNPESTDLVVDLSDYPTAVGIAFTIAERSNNLEDVHSLRETDFDEYQLILCSSSTEKLIDKKLSEVQIDDTGWKTDVVRRNYEKSSALAAMCRLNTSVVPNTKMKDMQFCIITDSHGAWIPVNNAVKVTNGFQTIDALAYPGDIMPSYYSPADIQALHSAISKLEKPAYIVIGNHDVGNSRSPVLCCNSTNQAYDAYIKPMVDKGWLASGEYQVNVPYWYHDDADYKIRLIGICEYEAPMDIADSEYWEAVTYDSSKPNLTLNTTYSANDIVNCNWHVAGLYTDHSFRCKKQVTTPNNWFEVDGTLPCFKLERGFRLISETQANWFLDKLATTPADYGVVVLMHQVISPNIGAIESKFTDYTYEFGCPTYMETDFLYNAITAFINGSNYSENVVMKGDASYLNTQGGGTYAYSVSKNFGNKNSGVKFFGVINGHSHRDGVWKKGSIYGICSLAGNTYYIYGGSKIRRKIHTEDDFLVDSLNVVSFAEGRMALAKIGVNVTDEGNARDFEVIDTSV